jgi:hypothetical protein
MSRWHPNIYFTELIKKLKHKMPFGCEVAHINNKAPLKSTIEMVTHRRLKNRKSKHPMGKTGCEVESTFRYGLIAISFLLYESGKYKILVCQNFIYNP